MKLKTVFSSDITEKTLEESLETSFLNSVPKKGEHGDLLERLNSYHPNIVLTVEENPDHFLDTALNLLISCIYL